MKTRTNVLSSDTLTGDTVKNISGENLGEIKDLMIDLDTGRVAYAVLSFGGFMGLGDKLFAIPWQALTVDTNDHSFRLDIPKEKLENAPGFDQDNWPDFANREWGNKVYSYYGYKPYWHNN